MPYITKLNNISFSSRLPEGQFCDVKDIPNIKCALCGKTMLSQIQYDTFTNKDEKDRENIVKILPAKIRYDNPKGCTYISRHYKEIRIDNIENSYKNYLETPNNERKNTDKQIKNVFKALCEEKQKLAPNQKLTNEEIVKKLEKISDILPQRNSEFVQLLKYYVKTFPDATLTEIMNSKTLYNYHSMISSEKKINYRKQTKEFFYNLNKKAPNLTLIEKIGLEGLLETINKISTHKQNSKEMKQKFIKDECNNFLATVENTKTKNYLRQKFEKLPIYTDSADSLFCDIYNCKFKNDEDIIKYLISPVQSTFEHVKAKSQGGEKENANGIYMHAMCNTERATYPYIEMSEIYPDFPKNIQKQINRISSFIRNDKLLGYDNWPEEIQRTLSQTANINIKI